MAIYIQMTIQMTAIDHKRPIRKQAVDSQIA